MEKFNDYKILVIVKEIDRVMPNFIGFLEYIWEKRLKSEYDFRLSVNAFKNAFAKCPTIPYLAIIKGDGIRKRGRPRKAKLRIIG